MHSTHSTTSRLRTTKKRTCRVDNDFPIPSSSLSSLLLLLLLLSMVFHNNILTPVSATFTWDHDSREDCEERKNQCTLDAVTYYQCPVTCSSGLKVSGSPPSGVVTSDPDDIYELSTPLPNGKTLSWDRFEGSITLVVVIPLLPGMAQYYYDMMEHLHNVFPYTLEIVIFPIRRQDHPDLQFTRPQPQQQQQQKDSKIIVTKELQLEGNIIEANDILQYLESIINGGYVVENPVFTDRVTCYMISFNAKYIEKEASPTLDLLEGMTSHHLTAYEWKGEI